VGNLGLIEAGSMSLGARSCPTAPRTKKTHHPAESDDGSRMSYGEINDGLAMSK